MTEDVTKLPKWAQQRIALLERNLAHAESKLVAMHDGTTDVFMQGPGLTPNIPLPPRSNIIFQLDTRITLTVGARWGYLEVQTSGFPYTLLIQPQSIDVARISVGELPTYGTEATKR